jgi:Domain of unknown function (DUF4373)
MNKSFYFQHDYNAANDHKILFLRQQFGIEGYGIYWYIIEQLAQSNGRLPIKIVPVMAMQIQTTPDKVLAVIHNYDLFTIDENHFFSQRLLKQIEFRAELSESGSVGAKKRWDKYRLKQAENSPPISPPNAPAYAKERKGKERKGEFIEDSVSDWSSWGDSIVKGEDHIWEQMRGRKVSQDEMDSFLSVATRNKWTMESQQEFRTSLKGFKDQSGTTSKTGKSKYGLANH